MAAMTSRAAAASAVPPALPAAACLTSEPVGDAPAAGAPALGSFAVASRTLGDETFAPSVCTSGDRRSFLGADLAGPASALVLRLAVDPIGGPAVRLFSSAAPFDRSVVFRRADCAVFHYSLEGTGWRVDEADDYRLTLELDCSSEGERLAGSASSSHCH